jgi:hypothetical protein
VSAARSIVIAVAAGLVVGVLTQLGQAHLPDALQPIANSISMWLVLAFAVGSVGTTAVVAASAGWISLISALVGYYGAIFLQFGYSVSSSSQLIWGVSAFIGGVIFGLAGWAWRNRTGWTKATGVGLLAAAFIADALYEYAILQPEAKAGALIFLAIGAVVPFILVRDNAGRARAYAAVVPCLALAAIGYVVLLKVMLPGGPLG